MTAPSPRSAAPDAIPGALTARFSDAVSRLLPEGRRLGLAVSGGPDSLAMMLLANAAIPGRFEVATVNHGLRAASADECALVASLCALLDIPCTVVEVQVSDGNVQSMAREARYAALAEWAEDRGLAAVATAHHADDQAETLLMRLNRGSGVAGLAGIRETGELRGGIPLVRPLLSMRRTELMEVVRSAGITPVQDPSNADDRFDRARLRKSLADADWLDVAAVARSAAILADADDALDWAAEREWTEQVTHEAGVLTYRPSDAPQAIRLRVIERAIRTLGGEPRGGDVARLLQNLEAGDGGNVAGVLAKNIRGAWTFSPEPPRRSGS